MKAVLGVDPDVHGTGVALVTPARVLGVGVAISHAPANSIDQVVQQARAAWTLVEKVLEMGPVEKLVVEFPGDYGAKRRARVNDLIRLSAVAGAVAAIGISKGIPIVKVVKPMNWKGNVPKPISHARVLEWFGWNSRRKGGNVVPEIPLECQRFTDVPESSYSEILDAMGIALWGATKL